MILSAQAVFWLVLLAAFGVTRELFWLWLFTNRMHARLALLLGGGMAALAQAWAAVFFTILYLRQRNKIAEKPLNAIELRRRLTIN